MVLISVRGWVDPRATVRPEGLFIHSVFSLTTGSKPPPKWFLHIVRSRASTFKWQYPVLSVRSSSSYLRLLPRLLDTSISPFIFPSITCFRRKFLRKMWPIQLAFRFLISCRSGTVCDIKYVHISAVVSVLLRCETTSLCMRRVRKVKIQKS